MGRDQLRQAEQHVAAEMDGHGPPGRHGVPGGGDRLVDLRPAPDDEGALLLAGGGIDVRRPAEGRLLHPDAADEHTSGREGRDGRRHQRTTRGPGVKTASTRWRA